VGRLQRAEQAAVTPAAFGEWEALIGGILAAQPRSRWLECLRAAAHERLAAGGGPSGAAG